MHLNRHFPVAVVALVVAGIANAITLLPQRPHLVKSDIVPVARPAVENHTPHPPRKTANPVLPALPEQKQRPSTKTLHLPLILSKGDISRYRAIFRAIHHQNWNEASNQQENLHNPLLDGHITAEKLLHPKYIASYQEVTDWLTTFPDHPQAPRLMKLALKKQPAGAEPPPEIPETNYLNGYGSTLRPAREANHRLFRNGHWEGRPQAQQTWRQLHLFIGEGWVSKAYDYLRSHRQTFTPLEYDHALWRIAAGYFAYGKDETAYRVARLAAQRSGNKVPELHWYAGLASWRMNRPTLAARHFSTMASASTSKLSPWHISAAAYWGYRSYHMLGNHEDAQNMLTIAAKHPRTFYGILAARAQTKSHTLNIRTLPASAGSMMVLREKYPGISRAIALIEIGRADDAEMELRHLYLQMEKPERPQLLALTRKLNLPALGLRIAGGMARQGVFHDQALYPVPSWRMPRDNPALLLAIIRQESGFRARVKSYRGARGLMQLMPRTAWYIARKSNIRFSNDLLTDPETNIHIGNHYLNYLRNKQMVSDNLMYLLAAYNAGPGKLNNWKKSIAYRNDPLLFMESIPSPETRQYIEQVMANYWIYQQRLGLEPESADAVISGNWPQYHRSRVTVANLE